MNLEQTVYYKPKTKKPATLLVVDKTHKPIMISLLGSRTMGRNYPESNCDIRLNSAIVSKEHGEFIFDDSDCTYYYIDNNSYNGTFLNGEKLKPYNERGSKAYQLSDGDIIRIDRSKLEDPHPEAVLIIFSTAFDYNETWCEYSFNNENEIIIGRDDTCSLKLNDLMASRCHAVIKKYNNEWRIKDNGSTNGVGVNGFEIDKETIIHDHDVIRIANTSLLFFKNKIIYNFNKHENTSLLVDIKDKTVDFGKKILLKNIKARFESCDFVLILGGSGAGKTTLIKAILGESKANGKIILNGQDLYKNFKSMKAQIDMVPQFLTLRKNDTVKNTLMDTAGVKLGRSYSKKEREERVNKILNHVGIKEHENKYISQLSGGQQKKVAVANQLVGFQKVFICDEPDSGLDAASRTQQMEILKEISLDNKIVMVITHEPDDAYEIINGEKNSLFTKVLVLAKDSANSPGRLAYFGDVIGAKKHFNVEKLQDIMLEINPTTEGGKGNAAEYIKKYEMQTGGSKIE